MRIWLVTTGSSDVQLQTDEYWNDWYSLIKSDCYNLPSKSPFHPTRAIEDEDEPYRVAPRVLGMVYQAFPEEVWDTLEFPLLKEFTAQLKEDDIDQIILLLTDQSQIFDETRRDDLKCPYWQDTSELQPIFQKYFQTHFPKAKLVPLVIAPQAGESGLDDWNFVLDLVRSKLKETVVSDPSTVYVSHQASTPAISSAVQFSSLARFRNDVQFLVSNEYHPDQTRRLSRSTYLRGIQQQEAKALLDRYDYSGVERLLFPHLDKQNPRDKRIHTLLKAAIEWNHAEFYKFKNILKDEILKAGFPWWRLGYESAYLAVVRLQQGNTVEGLFHSFRAVEGSIFQWAMSTYKDYIEPDNRYGPQLKSSICGRLPGYLSALSDVTRTNFNTRGKIGLYGVPLYELLKQAKPQWRTDPHISAFCNSARDKRNTTVHKIEGLQEDEVYQAWETQTLADWQTRVISCLNFVSGETFTAFGLDHSNNKSASLMAKVHQELEHAIDQL